ncbi:MAG: amino acid adenylation domain-containing protein, partial [Chloroflexi bacterium]|nr:amino acid adenylation domain-containing protein [Chloroflexota bacterium]
MDEVYLFPMSFAQQRLWFLAQLEPESTAYNIPAAVQIKGPLEYGVLKQSFNTLVARHELLRTTFALVDGQPVQIVSAHSELSLDRVDLCALAVEERVQEVQRQTAAAARHCFSLEQGPLLRVVLLCLAPDEHLLLLTLHHIVADGWSMGILVRELGVVYTAMLAGEVSPLPELQIQYADFAVWQHEWLSGSVRTEQLRYWTTKLAGAPTILELPSDRPRPPVQSLRGARFSFELSAWLTQGLRQVSQAAGATLFMTMAAAYLVLLGRYSHQQDLLVGVPVANRTRQDVEPLIGFFVNTVVLRGNLAGNPRFVDFLAQVRQMTLEAYHHQDLPFEVLVDELRLPRMLSHSPLFQAMLGWEVNLGSFERDTDLHMTQLPVDTGTAKFDLTLLLEEGAGVLSGVWEYSTDLFDAGTVERMARHFTVLLESIVSDAEQPIEQLALMDLEERRLVLEEWNRTAVDYGPERCVHALFEEQVARTPDALAVESGGKGMTYGELNVRANQLAHFLRGEGVGPEILVGVCCERTPELLVGLLGVLKAGGAYVPLDAGYPVERLVLMAEDAGVKLLLTQERVHAVQLAGLERLSGVRVVKLDSEWEQVCREGRTEAPVSGVRGEHLAYVIYTSGSTGVPKGVQIEHRGLVNYLKWAVEAYAVAEGEGAPVHSSIGFDATITSLYTPLLVGRKVTMVPEGEEIEGLCTLLQGENLYSLVKITPAHLEAMGQLWDKQVVGCGTRAYIIGGEALLERHIAFWRAHGPAIRLVNEYGPTETVVGCCVYVSEQQVEGAVPIGRPIANTELYVLDSHLQPVPIGVAGELYIGGVGVARGYLRRPDLTAERFIPNPFGLGRLYKTGDRVRYLADGNLVYLGRLDDQVKVRGVRIELGEVEAVLSRHVAVQAAVAAVHEGRGERQLVVYGVPEPAFQENPADLVESWRSFLRQQLPGYMVPSLFVLLDALPLTPNGKVDRRALPAPTDAGSPAAPVANTALTPAEAILAALWQQVLRLPQVGLDDNFFTIGGDSILSIQIVARARQAGLQITPRQIFANQTLRQLAAVAVPALSSTAVQEEVTGELPLTPIQRWFLDQGWADAHHFNQAVLVEVAPRLHVLSLQEALTDLLAHHDAL